MNQFVERIQGCNAEEKNVEIHLIRGETPEGIPMYAYLAAYPDLIKNMEVSFKFKTTHLEKYGIILTSGEGEPSDEVIRDIKEKYLSDSVNYPEC